MSEFLEAIQPPSITADTLYFLAQVGQQRLAFPVDDIVEVLLVERSRILKLPFYAPALLGVVHHQGQVVPLVVLQILLEGQATPPKEVFNAVQIHPRVRPGGLALTVDQLLGNCTAEQFDQDPTIELFSPACLVPELWQPRRWAALEA